MSYSFMSWLRINKNTEEKNICVHSSIVRPTVFGFGSELCLACLLADSAWSIKNCGWPNSLRLCEPPLLWLLCSQFLNVSWAALLSVLDYLMTVAEIPRIGIIYKHQGFAFLTPEGWKSKAPGSRSGEGVSLFSRHFLLYPQAD